MNHNKQWCAFYIYHVVTRTSKSTWPNKKKAKNLVLKIETNLKTWRDILGSALRRVNPKRAFFNAMPEYSLWFGFSYIYWVYRIYLLFIYVCRNSRFWWVFWAPDSNWSKKMQSFIYSWNQIRLTTYIYRKGWPLNRVVPVDYNMNRCIQ